MKLVLKLLLIYSASLILGCSSFPDSTREMESRAEYGKSISIETKNQSPRRKKQRVEKVFMGGRLLTSGDWFIGGKILLVVNEPDWIFEDINLKKMKSNEE